MSIRNSKLLLLAAGGLLTACAQYETNTGTDEVNTKVPAPVEDIATLPDLDQILAAQDDKAKARYQYRHPKETLEFVGIEPGMKVIEALPGGGWYSKILLPYLGSDGELIGVDYAADMWQHFGGFATPEFIEKRKVWVDTWTAQAEEWRGEASAPVTAFQFGAMPDAVAGTADAALFVRALHNLARFQDKGAYLDDAIKETYAALKPGGVVGVVQHQALEDRPDAWADGSNGYLKKNAVIEKFEEHGFEFVAESDINSNAKDQANEGDIVWRLPPTLGGAKDNEELRKAMLEIGESNRMTLKFRKPS